MTEDYQSNHVQVIGRKSRIYGSTVRLIFYAGDTAVAIVNLPAGTARTLVNDIENVVANL